LGSEKFEPVNKNASKEAKELLEYIYSKSGKKIISGHNVSGNDFNKWHKYVEDLTGKSPAIWGSGFYKYYNEGKADSIVNEAIKRYRDGYIVSLM
jgi:mannan endo-1,4-beta-mannosidase